MSSSNLDVQKWKWRSVFYCEILWDPTVNYLRLGRPNAQVLGGGSFFKDGDIADIWSMAILPMHLGWCFQWCFILLARMIWIDWQIFGRVETTSSVRRGVNWSGAEHLIFPSNRTFGRIFGVLILVASPLKIGYVLFAVLQVGEIYSELLQLNAS